MEKLPTKQIYLLSIIVVGLITLSAYSTYAIFTFESSTSDVVSINTPNSLSLEVTTSEYKQVTVSKNNYVTTDVDLYNSFNYEVCYSIWYKVITLNNISTDKVKLYGTGNALETTGVIDATSSKRVNIVITNDNDDDVIVKIGVAFSKKENVCNLNLDGGESQISGRITEPKLLSKAITSGTLKKDSEEGYLTYKDETTTIELSNTEKLPISSDYTYHEELFTLKDPIMVEPKDIAKYVSTDEKKYYTCLYADKCESLIVINKIKEYEETPKDETEEKIKHYEITQYDLLMGYLAGESGLRKIDKDYYYYGDNPNNFVLYNCSSEYNSKTCELWRIIGFVYNEETKNYMTKIIRDRSVITATYSDKSQAWDSSEINKYFEKDYKLSNTASLKEIKFKQQNITDLTKKLADITYLDKEYKSKITIMDLSDYLNASICEDKKIGEYTGNCLKANWLNGFNKTATWTKSVKYEKTTTEDVEVINDKELYTVGNNITTTAYDSKANIRPVVYLTERLLLSSGDGSIGNPYEIR